ncbi:MAG: TonB-dependent receptor, partial [Rhodanobacter sp.]
MSYQSASSALGAALAVLSFGAVPNAAWAAPELQGDTEEQEPAAEKNRVTNRSQAIAAEVDVWHGEPVNVTARGTVADWPSALAIDTLHYDNAIGEPEDFQDWITRVPGIGATGQNGLFETFSIRGSGGNGILILAAGVPIASQRRAGVPVSFVEPYLLGDVSVTRGPAVVHFGPGALGGAISLEPRWFTAPFATGGYASSGNESMLAAGTGGEEFSIAAARHRAGDTEAPNATPLNTSYARSSATLQFQHRFGAMEFDGLLMPSRTDDIGKSNSRYPDSQVTTYPKDDHTIGRLRVRHDGGFEASVYGHDQELTTFKQTPGKKDAFAYIGSTDGGAIVQRMWNSGEFKNNLGVEYFGRRDVTGYDAKGTTSNRTYSLDRATEDLWSLFALTDWRVAPQFSVELGARGTWIDQHQSGADSHDSDRAFTAAAIWTPGDASRWSLNLASGYRFPSLEERFYSGVTGRGEIVGNPDLSSEHSLGVDLGYNWSRGDWTTEVHLWQTNVDDLIQKVELQPDLEGFVNLGRARLHGAEATVGWTPVT